MVFEFSPEKLVFGGESLGYYEGRPVLAPRTLPGERLEVEAVHSAKGVLHVRPLRVLVPSRDRVSPPCCHFGRCGGCHYQHLDVQSQIAAKRDILRETLRRIGKIRWEAEIPVHASHPWHYRNQAQFKIVHGIDGRLLVGFFMPQSHEIAPVDACLIISPRLNEILCGLRDEFWRGWLKECHEVEALADDRDEEIMLTFRGQCPVSRAEQLARECLARLPGVISVAIETDRGLRAFGKPWLNYRVGDYTYRVSPGSFFQAPRFLLNEFQTAVTSGFAKSSERDPGFSNGSVALDLFAGTGLFTLPLARQFSHLIGVEANPSAAADLVCNADACKLTNIRVVREHAFDFLRRFAQPEPDLIVLDPPRAGVGFPTLKLLTALRPRHIHYASCHPPTLARDLGFLADRNYQIASVELFDFFPQTYHIESLVRLRRRPD